MATAAPPIEQHEAPPPWLIVLIASDDGVKAINRIAAALPRDLAASIVVIQHGADCATEMLPNVLREWTAMTVDAAGHGQVVEPGRIYVVRPDLHVTIDADRRFNFNGGCIANVQSSAAPFLSGAAETFKSRMIAVVLTGGDDASDGIRYVRASGGIVLVQDPSTIEHGQMAAASTATGQADAVLMLEDIAPLLIAIVRNGSPREALRVPALQW